MLFVTNMESYQSMAEIHKLLRIGPDLSKPYEAETAQVPESPINPASAGAPFDLPVGNIPTANLHPVAGSADEIVPKFNQYSVQEALFQTPAGEFLNRPIDSGAEKIKGETKPKTKGLPSWIVYPLVFVIAFSIFYILLNFNALLLQVQGWFAKDQDEQILEHDLEAYNKWIGGYYFSVKDNEKLKPTNDIDSDGLSNLDEFKIKTNPTVADSDDDGISDGVEVINGTNPWGAGETTLKQKKQMEALDVIMVNNRISFNAAAKNPATQDVRKLFDLTKPGRLTIPKLNIQVPLIWTEDPAQFDADLTKGVVHYPGTALPGETGIVYVSGHSSDYFWKDHPYKQVFARINALEPGDDIFVEAYGSDGKIYNYRYKVTVENVYAPDDQRQFIDNSGSKLNLSTCWPIGTQKDRYIVTAELTNL